MFIANIDFATPSLALPAEVPFTVITVKHILRETIHARVLRACMAVNLLSKFKRFFTEIACSAFALYEFLVVFAFFSQSLPEIHVDSRYFFTFKSDSSFL